MRRGLQPAPRALTAAQSHPRPPCDVPRTLAASAKLATRSWRSSRNCRTTDSRKHVQPSFHLRDRRADGSAAAAPSIQPGSSSCSSTSAAAAAVSSMCASRPTPKGRHSCSRARSEPAGRASGAGSADLARRRGRAAAQAAARCGLARAGSKLPKSSGLLASGGDEGRDDELWPVAHRDRRCPMSRARAVLAFHRRPAAHVLFTCIST